MKGENKLKIILLMVGVLCYFQVVAQQLLVKGQVKDLSGMPIAGASVVEKGTLHGVATDFDGNFELTSERGKVIVFSFVGFTTQEKTVTSTLMNVTLVEEAQEIEEVVIIGYGVARKKDVTGSVNLVSEKDFNKGQNFSASSMLQGKVAGVQITSGNGAPGAGQSIRVRGTGSLVLNSDPLLVVDGVPMDSGGIGGSRNILNSINPEDIESMTVLKDASSTAIYGSRAANGVIMIVTKKGKQGQELKVDVNSSISLSNVYKYVDVLNGDEYRTLINQAVAESKIADVTRILGKENTNWQKHIYQNAPATNTTVGISGSVKEVLPYRLSLGHNYADGVLKTDKFQRGTAKLSLTPKLFNDRLKVEFNIAGSYIKNNFADNGAIGSAVVYDPTQPIKVNSSKYNGYRTWLTSEGAYDNLAPNNPLALLYLKDDYSKVKRIISNLKLDYTLPFFPAITATMNVGIDASKADGETITDKQMPSNTLNFDGAYTEYTNKTTNSLFDFYLNYLKDFGKNSFSLMAGHSYQKFEYNNDNENFTYYKTEEPLRNHFIDKSRNVLASFFGRMNYSFDSRYMLTATLRADASSKLNPDDRWGYFPSVAVAWNAKNEKFLAEKQAVNELRLRFGYGEVGNVNGLGDYRFLTRYVKSLNDKAYIRLGDKYYEMYAPETVTRNLRWERANTLNVGIDYGFWNNRLYGTIDAYIKKTKDLITNSAVVPFTNFGSRVDANIGDMENKGIEALVNVVPVRTDNLQWTLSYNVAYNQNKVTNLVSVQNVGGIATGTGGTIQIHQTDYTPFTFNLYEQIYDTNGMPIEGAYVDRNNDGVISEADRYLGKSPYADVTMGLSTTVNYKNWDLNIATRTSIGNYVYDAISSGNATLNNATAKGVTRNIPRSFFDAPIVTGETKTLMSDMYLHNASFFKVDNITLGYTFPKNNIGVRLYGTVQNVLTVSKYKGLDPEIFGGIDDNLYPRPRTYMFGINVSF